MHFLGIDFGWRGKPSGLSVLDFVAGQVHLRSTECRVELSDILAWVREHAAEDCLIGVDAPLVIRNQEGMREADKLMHRHFGRFHAGAYPANLGLPHARRPLELSRMLEELGFQHGAAMQARASGRWQIEIHPHAAIVQLFDLPRIIRYKRGSVAERRAELTRYRELLCSQLPQLMPACDVNGHLPEIAGKGRALKDCEDRIDAVISAYIAAHWWYWGSERNTVFGDADDGYIIVPHRVQAG